MPKGSIKCQIDSCAKLISEIQAIKGAGETAIKNTARDIKARGPGWVASEVTRVYNIKKNEIVPAGKGTTPRKMAASLRVTGETIEDIALFYEGRLLTPVHFGMTPKAPPVGKNYVLKMAVFKGQRETIGRYKATRKRNGPYAKKSHNILMSTRALKKDSVKYIPFQRMSKRKLDLKKYTSLSVAQMIENEAVHERIMKKFNDEAAKRLEHNFNRITGR